MNEEIFSDIAIERTVQHQFGVDCDIKQVIVRDVPTSVSARATLFLTTKNSLYCLVVAEAAQTLGDVRTMIKRMNLEVDTCLPPITEPDYFNRVAHEKFQAMFPGLKALSDTDLAYYRTLVPYNPALVRIARIKNSEVFGFDLDAHDWRKLAEFSYSKISTKS